MDLHCTNIECIILLSTMYVFVIVCTVYFLFLFYSSSCALYCTMQMCLMQENKGILLLVVFLLLLHYCKMLTMQIKQHSSIQQHHTSYKRSSSLAVYLKSFKL